MTARTVTGKTVLPTGSAQTSQTVTFVKRSTTISGITVTQASPPITATTNSSGEFSASLDCPADGSTAWTIIYPDGGEFDFTLPYGDGSSVAVTTLISAATVDADAVVLLLDGYEPDLGNPGTSGHVLSSTTAGVRSWVAQSGGGASDVTDLTTTTGNVAEMVNVAAGGGLQYRTVAQVLADLRDSGALATADIGTLVQSYSAKTAAIAALTWAANSIILLTGTATASVQALAAHVVTFLQSASAADARTAIEALPQDAAILSKSGAYPLAAGDEGKIIECNGTFTITLPNGLDAGFQAVIVNTGTGVITLAATTTLTTKDSAVTLANQYGAATVYHAGSNVWRAFGDLS